MPRKGIERRHTPTNKYRMVKRKRRVVRILLIVDKQHFRKVERFTIIKFFVKCTKQDQKFSIVQASSDSLPFVIFKVHKSKCFNTYVIGDLGESRILMILEHTHSYSNERCLPKITSPLLSLRTLASQDFYRP